MSSGTAALALRTHRIPRCVDAARKQIESICDITPDENIKIYTFCYFQGFSLFILVRNSIPPPAGPIGNIIHVKGGQDYKLDQFYMADAIGEMVILSTFQEILEI